MTQIAVLGGTGRMGKMIIAEIAAQRLPAPIVPARGDDLRPVFEKSDVVIDFTAAGATEQHAVFAHQTGTPVVIGTTGLDDGHKASLKTAAEKAAVLIAPNTSLGVTLLNALVEQVAATLNDSYDIEIYEAHHRDKADAPSGTAMALAESAARGRKVDIRDALVPARFGTTGARAAGQIGVSVFRGGDVIGDHTVTFAGTGERIELTHKATDRRLFARGAIKAALFLAGKPAGLYTMKDVLGI